MKSNKKYWNGLEEYNSNPTFQESRKKEFSDEIKVEEALSEESLGLKSNRRDFLKIFGFGVTAATLAACETPVKKAIPYVMKPENVTPGVASWYASTCGGCAAGCGVLIKTREGRPIKIEGNPESRMSRGGVCSVGQSTVLSLYDADRLKAPRVQGAEVSWEAFDTALMGALGSLSGSQIAILSGTVNSPSTQRAIAKFKEKYAGATHVMYDAVSNWAIAKAHESDFGTKALPTYRFDKAEVIVSFGADFLGSWISPVEFTKAYIKGRKLDADHPHMSKHIQFEAGYSLTGSNADLRIPMRPSQEAGALLTLHDEIASATGNAGSGSGISFKGPGNSISTVAKELLAAKGKSLVVCGTNDVASQQVVNAINKMLGNYGKTVDIANPSYAQTGDDEAMGHFVANLASYKAVIVMGANPVYDHPAGAQIAAALKAMPASVSMGTKVDETAEACKFNFAANHFLENWTDAMVRKGEYHMGQPTIRPIYETRNSAEGILKLAGDNTNWLDFVQSTWVAGPLAGAASARSAWEKAVHDGVWYTSGNEPVIVAHEEDHGHEENHDEEAHDEVAAAPSHSGSIDISSLKKRFEGGGEWEVVLYASVNLRDGSNGNNPWLHETPDPVSKVSWDNYIAIPYKYAQEAGVRDGDMLTIAAAGKSITLPALVQPGQANNTVSVALGYGRTMAGRVGDGVGQNAFPMVAASAAGNGYVAMGAGLARAEGNYELAKVQTFVGYEMEAEGGEAQRKLIEGRVEDYIVKETTLAEYSANRAAGNPRPSKEHMVSLWNIHDKKGHHWAMAIDLNSCTGCGACIVSCIAENNIPVVGRQEVRNRREMHWMRLDRYYKGSPSDQEGGLQMMHQPMLCQHCDNAPCETVCPVLATVHSDEGLNQQVYNRCIGTRYCANNCPYKVRRFNWFSYYWNSDFEDVNYAQTTKVGKLVLNPDVTVRARGVMEKCSFCVQRIQEKKLKAKVENRKLQDGEIQTACQQSCPADAIVFGDLNDKNSEIWKLYNNKRTYHALEEVKTLPSVAYMTKVRNRQPDKA